jgi:hypothetical protein
LLDLQINGTGSLNVISDRLTCRNIVSYSGDIIISRTSLGTNTSTALTAVSRGMWFGPTANGAILGSEQAYSWSPHSYLSGTADVFATQDLSLARDAADTLAQRRTTNSQTFRVYGTFTDASNHVRAALSSTSTAVTLAAETAGTGADDIPLNLTAAGIGTIKVNSVAEVVVSSTVAGLPAAPVVGMLTRVTDATAPAVGVTVVGGGAAAALCWYNGASWSVIGV